jgi:arylsulfatase A-like enzyme
MNLTFALSRNACCLLAAALALATLVHTPAQAADRSPARPNIVLILADDQRSDTIGVLNNAEIHTPHLDRLAQRGFHFSNAYCMGSMIGAVCLPSRTMLITGRSLWRIPQRPRAKQAPPGVPLLPSLVAEAGYATFHCGKVGNSCTFGNAAFATNVELDGRTENTATEAADRAIQFLSAHDGQQPFFMYLAPQVPHDPRLAPERFRKLYAPDQLSLSKNFRPQHPFDNGELKVRDEMLAPHPRTPQAMRQHLADYYATISHLDHEIGRVLAVIAQRGWQENTVVIFTSDQGLAVGGRHGLMGKQNLYEHFKSPLVLAGPGISQGQSAALVYLFDLFPTICDLAGATTPAVIEGRSLMPIIAGQKESVRDTLFCAYRDCQRMVRDERWKLIEYNAAGVRNTQLFDLVHDPDELNNLVADLQAQDQLARLRKLLAAARQEYGDPIAPSVFGH